MSEPLATTDSFDTNPVPAPGPDTIRSLDAPAPAAPEPEGEPEAAPQGPSWADRNAAYQRSSAYQRRTSGRYRQQLQELEQRYQQTREQDNQILRQAIAALQGRGGQQETPPPDPFSPEFGAWLQAQITKTNEAQLKPVVEALQRQQEERQQQEEFRQREELAAAQSREEAEWLQGAAFEYEQGAPDVSFGHEDRFHTVRDGVISPAFQAMGNSPEQAAQLANSWYRLIARGEAQQGRNPVAAIDAFNSSLVMAITERLGMPMVPISGDGGGYGYTEQPAYQPQPAIDPQQVEIQRQENVRRRTAAAGSAAPRMAARGSQPKSEAAQLFAAGVHRQPGGWARIQQAALRETGGDGQKAAILMQQFAE